MSNIVVGVADCKWSQITGSVLVTYALGSCIAVALHDPVAQVGGMLHYMLPESKIDREKAAKNPFMFADTGLPLLISRLVRLGANKSRVSVRIAGGANVLDVNGYFDIGKRNYLALRKLLWKSGLMIHAEKVGGVTSRTVTLDIASGRFTWKESNGSQGELLVRNKQRGGN